MDELSALRTVVVEFQNRTAAQLLGQFSEEELAGIREAAGNSKYSSAIPMSLLSQGADPEVVKSTFASQDARRQRILHTYLAERRCLLKSIETLLQSVRDWNSRDQESTREKAPEAPRPWLQSKASEILQKFGSRNVFLRRAFSAIKVIAIKSESGSGCFAPDSGNNEIELAWTTSHLSEMIHAMEIVFDLVVSDPEITSANVFDQWLCLIQDCGFFESLSLVGIFFMRISDVSFTNESTTGRNLYLFSPDNFKVLEFYDFACDSWSREVYQLPQESGCRVHCQ